MKRITVFALLAFFSTVCATAQDTAYVRHVIRSLTSEQMYGRGASYHGDSIAADFIAGEFRRMGVRPLATDYLQHYTYNCYSNEGPISLRLNGTELKPYAQYRVMPAQRYLKKRMESATWKKQMKDGTWILGVKQLDTYGPIVGDSMDNPVCIEVLDTLVPKRVRRADLQLPLHYRNAYRSQNVVGYVQGVTDTMIVLTAHYDHCGTMGDGVVFYGAHDNASGTAAVLDFARQAVATKPYYTMVFMLFSGEESGLKGSRYASEHPLVDYSKVRLLCNLDMFCGGDEGIMVFNANSENTKPFVDKFIEANNETHAAREIRKRDNAPNSDHYYFSQYCPAIFLLTMGQRYGGYHDPADDCSSCGLEHYLPFARLIKSMIGLQ